MAVDGSGGGGTATCRASRQVEGEVGSLEAFHGTALESRKGSLGVGELRWREARKGLEKVPVRRVEPPPAVFEGFFRR